jgi:hypothetical protein
MPAATPFEGSAGHLAPRIIPLRPEPSQTAAGQGSGGTLAPVQQAPTLTPIGGAQPAAPGPAVSVAGSTDPESHEGAVRVGHDGGNGPGTGTGTVTTGKGSSGPAGGPRGQTGSGAVAGADGSNPSESAPLTNAPAGPRAGAPGGSGAAPAMGSAGLSGVGNGLSPIAPAAPSGTSRS